MIQQVVARIGNLLKCEASGAEEAAPSETASHAPDRHIGSRRTECWWEPIYAPTLRLEPEPYDWEVHRDSGPNRRFVSGDDLAKKHKAGSTFKITKAVFKDCDLQGDFGSGPFLMFDDCDFVKCDFAYSKWRDAHFRKCTFSGSSLSLSSFERCEFRDCTWDRIGVASKTDFRKSFINNPQKFISATVSNFNKKTPSIKHRMFQWYRLRSTRAHVLRNLLLSHETTGDEHTFFETVKIHELTRSIARACQDLYDAIFEPSRRWQSLCKLPWHLFDHFLLKAFGWLNNWGSSVVRPFVALSGCLGIFGFIYKYAHFSKKINHPFQKSFDITLLVGYGNQVDLGDKTLTIVQNTHVVMSLIIYTVFFATIVSKLSRAR